MMSLPIRRRACRYRSRHERVVPVATAQQVIAREAVSVSLPERPLMTSLLALMPLTSFDSAFRKVAVFVDRRLLVLRGTPHIDAVGTALLAVELEIALAAQCCSSRSVVVLVSVTRVSGTPSR